MGTIVTGTIFKLELIYLQDMTENNQDYHVAISDSQNFEIFKK